MGKKFGIVGAGNAAQTFARLLSKAGYGVMISNDKNPESLAEIVANLGNGVKAGTASEAAESDIVILALPWMALPSLPFLTNWNGKFVIDATNSYLTYQPDFKLADLGERTASEIVQTYIPDAIIVKAFNTLFYKILQKDPLEGNGRRVLFVSGDNADFKNEVSDIIKSLGFAPIDLGSLVIGGRLQQAKGHLNAINLIQL